jgi:hypothetical protein
MRFIDILSESFKENEPILTNEITKIFYLYTKSRIFQLINDAVAKNELAKFCGGVYFIPKKTILGSSSLDILKVIEKKYLINNGQIIGFYSGITFLQGLNLTEEKVDYLEIVSNNESSRLRHMTVQDQHLRLRKGRCLITSKNAPILQVLEVGATVMLTDKMAKRFKNFLDSYDIELKGIFEYIKYYPAKVLNNLYELIIAY